MGTENEHDRRAGWRSTSRTRTFTTRWAIAASLVVATVVSCAIVTTPAGASTAPAQSSTSTTTTTPSTTTTPTTTTSTTTTPSTPSTPTSTTTTPTTPSTPSTTTSTTTTPPATAATLPTNEQSYWLTTSGGAVYAFGGARQFGTLAGKPLDALVVGMAATPTEGGYWLVAADGGIFSFGNARFYGSMGGKPLDKPVVGMAATPTGGGYWLVAADGGIFTFGNARFYGSTGGKPLDAPVVGMAATPTGGGYWLVAADGGIFTFGSAPFYGSLGGGSLPYPITAMAEMFSGKGYWLTTSQGAVTNFGAAQLFTVTPTVSSPVVGMAPAKGNGDPVPPSYPPGSYGYDVSNYQCGNFPSGAHTIGIVEIDGWGSSYTNPCFVTEVDWAGPGVNLYMFMVFGTSATPQPGCAGTPDPAACNYGYATASSDFTTASSMVNGRATMPWWLDIESANWSASTSANASVVMGAIDALHADGVATVGFYFALDQWTSLMGTYDPSGPIFPAWWGGPSPATKCATARSVAASGGHFIPSGPIRLIQYTDNVNGFDGDYAC